jgi:hypothetical protein
MHQNVSNTTVYNSTYKDQHPIHHNKIKILYIIKLYHTAFKYRLHAPGTEFTQCLPFKLLCMFDNKRLYIL